MGRLTRLFLGDKWEPRRCCWPYPEGWATYNRFKNAIADTGLTKEEAQRRCDELNQVKHGN